MDIHVYVQKKDENGSEIGLLQEPVRKPSVKIVHDAQDG